jgi:probable F420-dependent oxidoreductase
VTDAAERLRAQRIGIWTGTLDGLPIPELTDTVAELDEIGFGSIWFGEAYGRESLTQALVLAQSSSSLVIGTGIANIYARGAMATAGAARLIEAAAPGRFVLGLGVSHKPLVERDRKSSYTSPIETMSAYLDELDAATYFGADAVLPPVVLAALGPKMLGMARDRTAGAHPYLVTPEHTRTAREVLGPDALLVVEQAAVLDQDRAETLRRAHEHLIIYTGLPNYKNNWRRLGFDDTDFVRGGSDRLAETFVVGGDEASVLARAQEHLDAGADHVCLQVLSADMSAPRQDWRRIAGALT